MPAVAAVRSSAYRPRSKPADVIAQLRAALPAVQARAPALDARGAVPCEDIALLKDIGASETFGNGEASPLELMEVLRLTGRANLSLGRIFEGHVHGARLIAWYGDEGQRRCLEDALQAGQGCCQTNGASCPNSRLGRLESDRDGARSPRLALCLLEKAMGAARNRERRGAEPAPIDLV